MFIPNEGSPNVNNRVTDALHKYEKYTLAKPFKHSNVSAWIADLQHAWNTWHNSIKDPEHMAAVEITQQVIKCDDPDLKTWALQYSLKVGDSAYTVTDFLETVQRHDKNANAYQTKDYSCLTR